MWDRYIAKFEKAVRQCGYLNKLRVAVTMYFIVTIKTEKEEMEFMTG